MQLAMVTVSETGRWRKGFWESTAIKLKKIHLF